MTNKYFRSQPTRHLLPNSRLHPAMQGMAKLRREPPFHPGQAYAKVWQEKIGIFEYKCTDHCSYDLPADVFVDGETRPTRTKRKAAPKTAENAQRSDTAKTNDATTKKRSFSNTGLDVCDHRTTVTERSSFPAPFICPISGTNKTLRRKTMIQLSAVSPQTDQARLPPRMAPRRLTEF